MRNYFNTFQRNMSFSFDKETSFLGIETSQENGKFVAIVHRKPNFSGVYTHFERFLAVTHKFGMLYTLICRCFTLCSDWTKFHGELVEFSKMNFPKKWLSNIIYR